MALFSEETVFTKEEGKPSRYEDKADLLLNMADVLTDDYWLLHDAIKSKTYSCRQYQMQDAQQLGHLAEVINQLRSAQGRLRCINGINVK